MKNFSKLLAEYRSKVKCKDIKKLFQHSLFQRYVSIYERINSFDMNDKIRNELLKILLKNKYKFICIRCLDLIYMVDLDCELDLQNQFSIATEDIIQLYSAQTLEDYKNLLSYDLTGENKQNAIKDAELIHEIIFKFFNSLHDDNVEWIKSNISKANGSLWGVDFEVGYFIRNCEMAFDMAFVDAEKTMKILNGKLTAIIEKYKHIFYTISNEHNYSLKDLTITDTGLVSVLNELLKISKSENEINNSVLLMLGELNSCLSAVNKNIDTENIQKSINRIRLRVLELLDEMKLT